MKKTKSGRKDVLLKKVTEEELDAATSSKNIQKTSSTQVY